jgi:hypothetical protein
MRPRGGRACPLDGTTMEHRDDGLDLAVRLTLAYGGDLVAVEGGDDLAHADGIGAILRF